MERRKDSAVIGVDLGGTKVLAGRVSNDIIVDKHKVDVPSAGSEEEVFKALCNAIDPVMVSGVDSIGVGVPSVVDVKKGIVYDVQNIASWKEVYLKDLLEERYKMPVFINNDANCFAIGEKFFGACKDYKDVVGLIVGTGLAAGIVINDRIYAGFNCGAGEFGMIPYLDKNYEYYCCGQFFSNVHNTKGEIVFSKAQEGDPEALALFHEFGLHLGNAISMILYAYDPEIIVLGGSASKALPYFEGGMKESLQGFAYSKTSERITIIRSTQSDIALLGAAALCFDSI